MKEESEGWEKKNAEERARGDALSKEMIKLSASLFQAEQDLQALNVEVQTDLVLKI